MRVSGWRALWRGLTLRCARCGSGKLFRSWTRTVDACPRCGLVFEAEEGYWVGAMTLNIVVTEALTVVLLLVGVVLTWPELPVLPLVLIGVGINAIFPIVFYPISKTLWVATDLVFFNPHRRELPHG
jgi:uncharacterized protein (DUF983 family)